MRNWRWLMAGAAAVICVLLIFAFQPRKNEQHTRRKIVAKPQDSAHLVVKDVVLSLLDKDAVVRWELKIANVKEDSTGMILTTVGGRYFPEQGQPFTLKAQKGRITRAMNRLVLEDGVQLTQPGYILSGRKLIWLSETEGFQMLGGVRVESNQMRGEGEKMDADGSLKHVKFVGKSVWRAVAPLSGGAKK